MVEQEEKSGVSYFLEINPLGTMNFSIDDRSDPNFMAEHPIIVEIFKCKTKVAD